MSQSVSESVSQSVSELDSLVWSVGPPEPL